MNEHLTRREFVKVGTATVALLASVGSVTGAEEKIKPEELKKKLLGDKKFCQLKLNRKQAEERYQQLLARVPEKYRPTIKLPAGAVNRKNEVLKAWEKYQDYSKFYLGPLTIEDDGFNEKAEQYFEEANTDDIAIRPFTDDAIFERIQQWLTVQKTHFEKIVTLLNERDYCSEHDRTDWHFYPLQDFQVSDLYTVHREFAWHIKYLCFTAARKQEWDQISKYLDVALRYNQFLSRGKLLLIDYVLVSYLLVFSCEISLRVLQYPELPDNVAQELLQRTQNYEVYIPDLRQTMVMEIVQFGLSQFAAIPKCKQPLNQALAMLGFGLKGQTEHEVDDPEAKENNPQDGVDQSFLLHYYTWPLLTQYELGKLLEKHPQTYDPEATFKLWLTEQTSWFDFYDQHRHDIPFPKYESPHPTPAWMRQIPYLESIVVDQSELNKLHELANLNEFDRIEWCEKLDQVTNPLGILYVAPINIRDRESKPRTISTAAFYETMVTGFKQSQIRLLTLAAACLIYERKNQRLPVQLSELVKQKILPALPIDPSSGKDFHYDPAKRLLWGANGLDIKTGKLQEYDETSLSNMPGIQIIPKLLAELSK